MGLSDHEKQILAQMEAELRRESPELAHEMSKVAGQKEDLPAPRGRLSPRFIALGVLVAIAGMGVLLGAVSLGHGLPAILLGVVGFALMVCGILLATRSQPGPPAPRKGSAAGRPGAGNGWAQFIADQERRWDERSGN
ncbi:MAG: DUF3040 domain-containing protein [Actinomycetaceae bacterium]|nr:DUF3040 domain-containing protein [Actinomycetaceae bacterium]